MDQTEPVWHREVVDASVERTLRDLERIPIVARFYLAGGTALALHLGHRRSVDLDFFLGEDFDVEPVLQHVQQLKGFSLVSKTPRTNPAFGSTHTSRVWTIRQAPQLSTRHSISKLRSAPPGSGRR